MPYSGRQNSRKSPFLNNFFEIMKKRHNSAPRAPYEASPYLNESSRCAESESEEHFVRKAHFSGHFSFKNCYFFVKKKRKIGSKSRFSAIFGVSLTSGPGCGPQNPGILN